MKKLSLIIPIGIVVLLVAGVVVAKAIERNPATVLPSG